MDAFLMRAKSHSHPPPQKPPLKGKPAQSAEEHPKKKIKREETYNSDADSDLYQIDTPPFKTRSHLRTDGDGLDSPADDDVTERSPTEEAHTSASTAIESSLPEIKLDKKALEEYRNFKSSQEQDVSDASTRLSSRAWERGKSSLYVDAFNLALDTVLDEEAHLFDSKERRIFGEWRFLDYEAQFLYACTYPVVGWLCSNL